VSLYAPFRGNQDAYDTNKMAEEFTHFFLDQAFSVGQQVQEFCKKISTSTTSLLWCDGRYSDKFKYMSVLHLLNLSL